MNDTLPNGKLVILGIVVVVLFGWLFASAAFSSVLRLSDKPNFWPKAALALGLIIMAACWFFGSLLGVIAGGFVAMIGAVFVVKK